MNDKPETKIDYISPLKRICMTIGELPTSYLETMSYYEMLVWFVEFLRNQVIPVVNNNSEATKELQNLFVELQDYVNNYFDNLDVQEEINNKLDEMVESGVLEQIIEQYLNSSAIWGFDTVTDMKQATNLIDGSYAKTLGYYEINDGGGATYKITDEESETDYQEELENGLYATLIINSVANIKQYGVSETLEDNSIQLTNAIKYNSVLSGFDGTIYVKNKIEIEHSDIHYDFKGLSIIYNGDSTTQLVTIKSDNVNRITGEIKNLNINSNGLVNSGISIYDGRRLLISHCKFRNSLIEEIGCYQTGGNSDGCNVVLRDIRCDCGIHTIPTASNCIALDLHDCHDCYINDFIVHDYSLSIKSSGFNWFDMVHGWNWYNIANSVLFELHDASRLSNIHCDTIECMLDIRGGQNVELIMGNTYYNSSAPDISNMVIKPIKVDNDFVNNYGRLKITSSWFRNYNDVEDLIVFPVGVTSLRINMISIENTYISQTFKIDNSWVEYYYNNLSNSDIDYTTAGKLTGTVNFYRKKITTIKGKTFYDFVVNATSIDYSQNPDIWTEIFRFTKNVPIVSDETMFGYVRDDSGNIYPIQWRIRSNNIVQIRTANNNTPITSGTISLVGNVSQNVTNPFN